MNVNEIRNTLIAADNAYYNLSNSTMSDKEYDIHKDILRKINPEDPYLKQIGANVEMTEWKKYKHTIPMYSLNKVNSVEEFTKWANEINDEYYMVMDKLDGASLSLDYKNGNLVAATTRGDGIEGEMILSNVLKMKNVKKNIPNFTGSLRAEIFLLREDFEEINRIKRENEEKEFSNPRNAANGIAKRFDRNWSEYLSVLHYDIIGIDVDSESEKFLFFDKNEIKICFHELAKKEHVIEIFHNFENYLRAKTKYDIDGLVIKCNNIKLQEKHGFLGANLKAAIAWKFEAMSAETTLLDVEWSLGNSGRITPVAIVEKVPCGGVNITHVTLHNVNTFLVHNLRYNDKVQIKRANDVIPYFEKVIFSDEKSKKIEFPIYCPICNDKTTIEGEYLVCKNPKCDGLMLGNINKWINSIEIMDVGDKIIEQLYKHSLIKDPADLYTLKKEDILKLERMGERSTNKLLENINSKKEITIPQFISGLNMPNFSGKTAESIIKSGYDTIDKIQNLSKEELVKISGIGEKTADQIINGLNDKKIIIEKLLKVITIKQIERKKAMNNNLEGKSFCFTGAIQRCEDGKRLTRENMWDIVLENGGVVEVSVKKGLSYLVVADPNSVSSKTQKAKKLGVEILSESDFFKMINM